MTSTRRIAFVSLLVGIVAASLWFLLVGRVGLDFADEGYLWYGAQRLLHREVPMRDFHSYDPARYAYAAWFMSMRGDTGLMSLRVAAYSVMSLLVAATVFVVAHGTRRLDRARSLSFWAVALATACLALLWAYPYYKVFDHAACMMLVLAVYAVLLRKHRGAWFVLGLCIGFVAVVGRNHGLYGVLGGILAFLLLAFAKGDEKPTAAHAGCWLAGIVVGYSPMLVAFLTVDGFFHAFQESVLNLFRLGRTNLPLPVPWTTWAGPGFLLLLAFPLLGLAYGFVHRSVTPGNAAFLAASCVALPYAHYAFSRADVIHLGLAIYPALVGLLTIPFALRPPVRTAAALGLVLYSTAALSYSTSVRYLSSRPAEWSAFKVRDADILVTAGQAELYQMQVSAIASNMKPNGSFLAIPDLPGLHALYEMPIATFDSYITSPASTSYEDMEIARIVRADPDLILVSNHTFDHDEALRFSNIRPRTYRWINEHYRRVLADPSSEQDSFQIYRRLDGERISSDPKP